MQPLPRVYVPNKSGHDYTNAWRFGDLIFCSDGYVNRKDIQSMYSELTKAMYKSEPSDYIMLTSLTSLCSIACSIFVHKHGVLNLLIFEDGEYISRTVQFP